MDHEQAKEYAVKSLSSRQGENSVHAHLKDCGFSAKEAEDILQAALKQVRGSKLREKKKQQQLFQLAGMALCISGIGMMIYSFTIAKSGGMLIVPIGLIGYGFYLWAAGASTTDR